jgi:NAD(P)-dependent dehydrogenase (short-subunit alcohol dehydrogenase family)
MTATPTTVLKGKTAIITGAGRGIGRGIARRLSIAGANVAIASRTESQLEQTRRMIERAGGNVLEVTADVSREEDVERMVEQVQERFGRIDVLVNNAGAAQVASIVDMEPHVFDRIVAVNIRAVYLCSRAVWPIMAAAEGGTIINITSMAAYDPFPGFAAYGAAKRFVGAYTKGLAAEGKTVGIRVYAIAPGAVETEMLRGSFPDFPAERTLQPDDVAVMVENLLSPACAHIVSGQTIQLVKT